jgi:hypothetical protein
MMTRESSYTIPYKFDMMNDDIMGINNLTVFQLTLNKFIIYVDVK